MNPRPKNNAFTHIELMICVSLIAIIASFAVPYVLLKQKQETPAPAFPTEKVLTCSVTEWCESAGRRLDEFNLIGFQGDIRKNVPPGAVVVVSYRYNGGYNYGTAIVPKAQPEKEQPAP